MEQEQLVAGAINQETETRKGRMTKEEAAETPGNDCLSAARQNKDNRVL